jgi:FkbM family methyltransferase
MVKRIIQKTLGILGYEIRKKQASQISLDKFLLDLVSVNEIQLIEAALKKKENVSVIVGAHDFVSFDFVSEIANKYDPNFILFEPRGSSFKSLGENILRLNLSNCRAYQLCVHPSVQEITMYSVKNECLSKYPKWAEGIASINKSHLLKHVTAEDIEEIKVECINPDNWHSQLGIGKINLLQIDTEGFDFEILKSVNIPYHNPTIIKIKIANLQTSDKINVASYLHDLGYDCIFNGEDIIAFRLSELL